MNEPKTWVCNPVFSEFKQVPVMIVEVPYLGWDNQLHWRREEQPLRVYHYSHIYKFTH